MPEVVKVLLVIQPNAAERHAIIFSIYLFDQVLQALLKSALIEATLEQANTENRINKHHQ